jgi:hypothetical protein
MPDDPISVVIKVKTAGPKKESSQNRADGISEGEVAPRKGRGGEAGLEDVNRVELQACEPRLGGPERTADQRGEA